MVNLNEKEKEVLRKLVKNTCEQCNQHADKVGTLHIHRIKRGNAGGEYTLRNIKLVCNKCHKLYHYDEPGSK